MSRKIELAIVPDVVPWALIVCAPELPEPEGMVVVHEKVPSCAAIALHSGIDAA